jgi:FkbM family methyltransferase
LLSIQSISRTGKGVFKKCNAGNEVCSLDISASSTNEQVQVNITTLDDFTRDHDIDMIDLLKIDTEGYEPNVFRGAQRLLTEHRIRLFIFEYLQGNIV